MGRGPATKLTAKQNAFVAEYLVDLNGSAAAVRAGYAQQTADKISYQLLRKPLVAKAIDEALARRSARVEVYQDDVLRELMRVLTTDIGKAFDANGVLLPVQQIPEDVRRAIASIETDELFDGKGPERTQVGVTRKIKFWSKDNALALAMRHLGLLRDKVEHSLDKTTLEQLVAAADQGPDGGEGSGSNSGTGFNSGGAK